MRAEGGEQSRIRGGRGVGVGGAQRGPVPRVER